MPLSVQPLVIDYSFAANREQATDLVDAAQLDAVLGQLAGKLNEIIAAIDETTRDDDALDDHSIEPRHLSDEVYKELSAIAQQAAVQA